MMEDNQGTFWFCTLDDGIYGLPQNTPISYQKRDGLPSDNLISVARDNNGRILFGDDEGNLNILSGNTLDLQQYHSVDGYNRILSIAPISQQETWVVSDEGIFQQTFRGKSAKLPHKGSPKVVLRDGNRVLCGTSGKLFSVNLETREISDLFDQRITALGKDSDGAIWAGSIEGLYCSADSFRHNWALTFPQLSCRIIALQEDNDNTLWIATPEAGLLKAFVQKGKIVRLIRANDYLPKPIHNIHSLFREHNGRIWLATNRGIFGITPSDWGMVQYDHHDGLANDDVRSITVCNDTLWAATATGLTRMVLTPLSAIGDFPTFITAVRYQENDAIQEIYLDDGSASAPSTTLPVNAGLVEVDFAGLDYRSRGNLLFDCILTEVLPPLQWLTTDNLLNWIGSGFAGTADTTRLYKSGLDFGIHLPPGKYKMHVTAVTQNGVKSRQSGEWSIVMPAKWYSTFWFSLFLWFLIALAVHRVYRTRMKIQQLAFSVAQFRLFALQAQINPHFVGNSINAIQRFFYPPSPTKASEYNAVFTQLLRKTLDFSENTFIRFEDDLGYNRDYMELARLRYGDENFTYSITGAEAIPKDLPFPSLFLQPLLENATLHGSAQEGISTVAIHYQLQEGILFCTITDNGPGLQAKQGTPSAKNAKRKSKGIEMLRNKANTMNELFDLNLQFEVRDLAQNVPPGIGTKVTVSFQVAKALKAKRSQEILDRKTASKRKKPNSSKPHETS